MKYDFLGTRKPDFENILLVLDKKKPKRHTLFEFFMNGTVYDAMSQGFVGKNDYMDNCRYIMNAYKNAGYDYTTIYGSDFHFPTADQEYIKSCSLNEGVLITDRESFDKVKFEDANKADYSPFKILGEDLPEGMSIIAHGPGGVLENVIGMVGYDNLCYILFDDPQLAEDIFTVVGENLLKYYTNCGKSKYVGAMLSNDDWGFNTQTMFSVDLMRKYVFPWHKRIVEAIHDSGRPALLHSCGFYNDIIEDVINDMKYDGRHSYEDGIEPVEQAYDKLNGRLAILGGIDVDFLCRSTPEEIKARSRAMLERSEKNGGYALGSGNSIPDYVPPESYFAMISAIYE